MRKLLCIGAIAVGALLAGCGGTLDASEAPVNLGTEQQGLACAAPDDYCPPLSVCTGVLCRPLCPPSGICNSGRPCTETNGVPHC